MAAPHLPRISVDEFLDAEERAETKPVHSTGVVTARMETTFEHARIAMNPGGQLYSLLRERGCAVVGSDVMFQTGSKEMVTYPDLMVVYGPVERAPSRQTVITNPVFLVEVSSPSTEAMDRGVKSHEYRLSPSLQQYALICQDQPLVEIHSRCTDGSWRISEVMGLATDCTFSSLACSVPMAELHQGVLTG